MVRWPTLSPMLTIRPSMVAKRRVGDTRMVLTTGSGSFRGSARGLSARGAAGNSGVGFADGAAAGGPGFG